MTQMNLPISDLGDRQPASRILRWERVEGRSGRGCSPRSPPAPCCAGTATGKTEGGCRGPGSFLRGQAEAPTGSALPFPETKPGWSGPGVRDRRDAPLPWARPEGRSTSASAPGGRGCPSRTVTHRHAPCRSARLAAVTTQGSAGRGRRRLPDGRTEVVEGCVGVCSAPRTQQRRASPGSLALCLLTVKGDGGLARGPCFSAQLSPSSGTRAAAPPPPRHKEHASRRCAIQTAADGTVTGTSVSLSRFSKHSTT